MRRRARRFLALALLAAFVTPAGASAHGTLPLPHQIHTRHGVPDEVWIETTFGLVFGNVSTGGPWQWLCEEAVGYASPVGSAHAAIHVSSSGRVFAAAFGGLYWSDDRCSWSENPTFASLGASDVEGAPGEPLRVYATTNRTFSENALFRSDDGGDTFTRTVLSSDVRHFTSVLVAPSDPSRVYVSSWWFEPEVTMALHRSDDAANAFETIDVTPMVESAGLFVVHAVHPTNTDLLFAGVELTPGSDETTSLVLRSTNGGRAFAQVLEAVGPVSSIAFDASGEGVVVATSRGAWRSNDGGDSFEMLPSPTRTVCALHTAGGWVLCGNEFQDEFTLARVADAGTLEPILHLEDIVGPPNCPDGTLTRQFCEPIWPLVQRSFQGPPDAGALDAGSDAGTTPADGGTPSGPSGPGCGCGTGGASLAVIVGVGLALIGRTRRVDRGRAFRRRAVRPSLPCLVLHFVGAVLLILLGPACGGTEPRFGPSCSGNDICVREEDEACFFHEPWCCGGSGPICAVNFATYTADEFPNCAREEVEAKCFDR